MEISSALHPVNTREWGFCSATVMDLGWLAKRESRSTKGQGKHAHADGVTLFARVFVEDAHIVSRYED
jgi:hypothetical protein